eukprot:GCRY01009313.1.p1 GENE.GCRY01009313.1~~GCRY01009313.1.p1  ORF type:complete len:135 (-),score=27.83 GCRY01009313.1:28-432(-)
MHQPWASLLVHGIKKIEGRNWFIPHRGRLWIASTVREPEPEEIAAVESEHPTVPKSAFPQSYPTGVLLGCVDAVDCLDRETYLETAEVVEPNSSQYLLRCENPRQLSVPFPVSGQHKLWHLDKTLLIGAQAGLV